MAKYFDVQLARQDGLSERQINDYMKANNLSPKMTVGGFVGNVGKSTGKLVTDTAKAILNPVQTAKGMGEVIKNPKLLVDFYKQRYGKDLVKTLYEDPAGVLADLSVVLGGSGLATKALGNLTKSAEIANIGSKLSTASELSDPLRVIGKTTSLPFKGLSEKVGSKLEKTSESILTKGLGNTAKQSEILERYGVSTPEFIKKYKLFERSPESLKGVSSKLGKEYGERATSSGLNYNPQTVIDLIDKEIAKLTTGNAKNSVSNQRMAKELSTRREQFVAQLPTPEATTAPVSDLYSFRKEAIDPDIPKTEFGLSPKQSGSVAGTKKVRDILRGQLNDSDSRLGELGIDIAVSKKLEPVFRGYQSRVSNRQPLGLPKAGATTGAVTAGIKGAVIGAAVDYLSNQPKVLSFASRGLETAGKSLQQAKPITLPRSVQVGYELSRGIRPFNQIDQEEQQIELPKLKEEKLPDQPKLQSMQELSSTPILPSDKKLKKYTPVLKFGQRR